MRAKLIIIAHVRATKAEENRIITSTDKNWWTSLQKKLTSETKLEHKMERKMLLSATNSKFTRGILDRTETTNQKRADRVVKTKKS